jgi:glutathione S-transferase
VETSDAKPTGAGAAGGVKVFGMPPSQNACGPILLAMHAGAGSFEMCNLMEGAHMKPEFLAMNPFHHIPTVKDGNYCIGESLACLRYLALKYAPECYPVQDPCRCGMIDFACESFAGEVYKKIGPEVIYPVFGFAGPPADQAKSNKESTEALDTWMKHFVTGRFVCSDQVSIADFKAVPFLWAAMQPAVEKKSGFIMSDRAKQYVTDFMDTINVSGFMKSAGGFAIEEFAASKMPDAGAPSAFSKAKLSAAPALAKPDGKVKVHGMPPSANACSPVMLAMEAGVGGLEMCDLMQGAQMKPEYLAMNPFHHIPTVQDGGFAIGESNACLRYLALKYKPEYYPVKDPAACGMIDFACESFAGEVYPKLGPGVFYPVFGFGEAPADQTKANQEANEMLDLWMKHFVKGLFVNGDKVSIADFKAVPFIFAAMQPAIASKTGFKVPDAATQYVERFMTEVPSSAFLKSAGGYAIAEFAASKA